MGKHNEEMCLRGQVWKHVHEREAFERKVVTKITGSVCLASEG